MTNKEKIELKDSIINIFNRFNILDHTTTIGGLRDDILRYIDSLQEEPVFKVGDTIQKKDINSIRYSIINKTSDGYRALRGLSDTIVIWFSEQDQWELVKEPVSDDLEEKDFELTWEDIPDILLICEKLKTSWWFRDEKKKIGTQVFWEEALKRFKEQKEKL